jgi:hypothetical protein
MAKSTKALLTGRIQKCKTNPSIAHIGLATHGRSIQKVLEHYAGITSGLLAGKVCFRSEAEVGGRQSPAPRSKMT